MPPETRARMRKARDAKERRTAQRQTPGTASGGQSRRGKPASRAARRIAFSTGQRRTEAAYDTNGRTTAGTVGKTAGTEDGTAGATARTAGPEGKTGRNRTRRGSSTQAVRRKPRLKGRTARSAETERKGQSGQRAGQEKGVQGRGVLEKSGLNRNPSMIPPLLSGFQESIRQEFLRRVPSGRKQKKRQYLPETPDDTAENNTGRDNTGRDNTVREDREKNRETEQPPLQSENPETSGETLQKPVERESAETAAQMPEEREHSGKKPQKQDKTGTAAKKRIAAEASRHKTTARENRKHKKKSSPHTRKILLNPVPEWTPEEPEPFVETPPIPTETAEGTVPVEPLTAEPVPVPAEPETAAEPVPAPPEPETAAEPVPPLP